MHDHVKLTIRDVNPDHIILHCGTNDLNSERTASQIVRSIIELALSLKSKNNKISVSLIVPRNDNLNNKASEVICRLVHMCAERNIPYIGHINSIQPENHFNESKLHFTGMGPYLLQIVYLSFSLSVIDGVVIVAILIISFKKILTKN